MTRPFLHAAALSAIALLAFAGFAEAQAIRNHNSRSLTVRSGALSNVTRYFSFDGNCVSLGATFDVVTKPRNGTLVPRVGKGIPAEMRAGSAGQCAGRPVTNLFIDYRSKPGFKGVDTFVINVTFGYSGKTDQDTYVITVQ